MRSRAALGGALLDLIQRQPFEDIAIKDITAAANVSYPVFFRQFGSKEELLKDIAAEEIRHLFEYAAPMFDAAANQSGSLLCGYVNRNRTLWANLLTAGAAATMREEFFRISRAMSVGRKRRNPGVPFELGAQIVVGGIFEVLAWWLKQPEDYPVANIETLMNRLIIGPISTPFELLPYGEDA